MLCQERLPNSGSFVALELISLGNAESISGKMWCGRNGVALVPSWENLVLKLEVSFCCWLPVPGLLKPPWVHGVRSKLMSLSRGKVGARLDFC